MKTLTNENISTVDRFKIRTKIVLIRIKFENNDSAIIIENSSFRIGRGKMTNSILERRGLL